MKQWYVLRSKPKQETLAASVLATAGIETYVPVEQMHRQPGKLPAPRPFFPCYLFGRLDPERAEIRLASYTPGIIHVVGYGDEPWPVPDSLILYIQERLATRRQPRRADDLHPGDCLIISSGPLRGIQAIFDRHLSGTGRVRVLIRILARVCPAELHIQQVQRVGKAAGTAFD